MNYPNQPQGRRGSQYGPPTHGQYPTQQYGPPQGGPQQWPPPVEPKRRRKWPWIVGGVFVFIVLASLFSNNTTTTPTPVAGPTVPPPATVAIPAPAPTLAAPTSTAAPVVDVVLPEVKGRNGGIVYDELTKLGLTNLQLASRDEQDKVVVLPSNWTAVKIEPKAGTTVKSDQVVVVTMTKTR